MTTQVTTELEIDSLMREVRRYLAVVEAFRTEGREPRWLPEQAVQTAPHRPSRPRLDRG